MIGDIPGSDFMIIVPWFSSKRGDKLHGNILRSWTMRICLRRSMRSSRQTWHTGIPPQKSWCSSSCGVWSSHCCPKHVCCILCNPTITIQGSIWVCLNIEYPKTCFLNHGSSALPSGNEEQFAMENCRLWLIYLVNMVIIHSYARVPEGNHSFGAPSPIFRDTLYRKSVWK